MYTRPLAAVLATLSLAGVMTLPPADAAQSLELQTEYRVLAVGIDDYHGPARLRGCANDARAIGNLLGLGRPSAQVLLNGEATRENILAALNSLAEEAVEGERVALFLSGHGLRLGKRWYFVPANGGPADPELAYVSGRDLLQTAEQLVAKRCTVFVMIDACFSGEFVKECDQSFHQWATPDQGGLVIFASSSSSEISQTGVAQWYWDLGDYHSLFTACLLDALSPKVPFSFGTPWEPPAYSVTLKSAKSCVGTAMRERIEQYPKLLGLPRDEQELVAEWSSSISESLPLVEYRPSRGPYAPIPMFGSTPERRTVSHSSVPERIVNASVHPVEGTWKATRTYTQLDFFVDGRPNRRSKPLFDGPLLRREIVLQFDEEGHYVVAHGATDIEKPLVGTGRYVYTPGEAFELRHETGVDKLNLISLTEDELIVEYYVVGPNLVTDEDARRPERWTFTRVRTTE